jgi:hypothetical protein
VGATRQIDLRLKGYSVKLKAIAAKASILAAAAAVTWVKYGAAAAAVVGPMTQA